MFVLKELFELLLIPKLGVTGTAQCLEIFYVVCLFAPTHSPRFNMMDVNRSCSTHLARDEVTNVIAEVIQVGQGVFLHLVNSNDQDVGSEIARSNLNPQFSNS